MRIAWQVLLAIVQVVVGLLILGAGEDRFQRLVLAGLIEIYAILRLTGVGLDALFFATEVKNLSRFARLSSLLKDEAAKDLAKEAEELEKKQKKKRPGLIIYIVATGILSLAALYKLVSAALWP